MTKSNLVCGEVVKIPYAVLCMKGEEKKFWISCCCSNIIQAGSEQTSRNLNALIDK